MEAVLNLHSWSSLSRPIQILPLLRVRWAKHPLCCSFDPALLNNA